MAAPRALPRSRSGQATWVVPLRILCVVGVALAAWFLAHHLVRPLWHGFFDLKVYRGAVQWWGSGHPLYTFHRDTATEFYGFTYPPFAAVVLWPLGLGSSWPFWAWVMSAASLAVVVATTWRFLEPVVRRLGGPAVFVTALAVPVVLLMDPVRETIAFGQINLYLVALVLADAVAIRRGWRWAGAGTGIATAIKLTPGIFILYFLVTRRTRPAVVAVGAFAAATLAAFLISPHTSVEFWTSTLWDTSRVGHTDKTSNQSLLGVLTRLLPSGPAHLLWVLLGGGLVALALWRARRAWAAGDELVGLTLTGLSGVLISPISWTHHLYWLVPAVIVLVDVATGRPAAATWPYRAAAWRGRRAAAGIAAVLITVACWTSLPWYFQRDEGLVHVGGLLGVFGENSFALAMVALVVLLPVRGRTVVPPGRVDGTRAVAAAD